MNEEAVELAGVIPPPGGNEDDFIDWTLVHDIKHRLMPLFESQYLLKESPAFSTIEELSECLARFGEQYFRSMNNEPERGLPARTRLWDEKAVDGNLGAVLIRILELQEFLVGLPIETVLDCWSLLLDTFHSASYELASNSLLDLSVKAGIVDVAVAEMKRAPSPGAGRNDILEFAVSCMLHICLVPKHVNKVIESGLVEQCICLAKNYPLRTYVPADAIICLANLTVSPESHQRIKSAGAVELCLPLLDALSDHVINEMTLNLALTALSLILRTCGKENSCPVHGNEHALERLLWILNYILEEGPENNILGCNWDPANVMLDLYILSLHDANKRMLTSEQNLNLLRRCLTWDQSKNVRLLRYTLLTLKQLYFQCVTEVHSPRWSVRFVAALLSEINTVLAREDAPRYDVETFQLATAFKIQLSSTRQGLSGKIRCTPM